MHSRVIAVVSLALWSAACGGGGTTVEHAVVPSGDVACMGPPFDPSALDGPADAETRQGPEYDVLRQTIGSGLGTSDSAGFLELGRTAEQVAFAVGQPPALTSYVVVDLSTGGARYRSSGGLCLVRPHYEGFTLARWGLDPRRPAPTPQSDSISVIVNDTGCAGGKSPEKRLQPPFLKFSDSEVVVTFLSRPLDGTQTCPSHPPVKRDVTLDEPLGHRALKDGGLYPPQDPCPIEGDDCMNPHQEFSRDS